MKIRKSENKVTEETTDLGYSVIDNLATDEPTKKKGKFKRNLILFVVLLILILGGYLYITKGMTANNIEKVNKENLKLVQRVGELMILPQGEDPAIYNIDNPDVLKKEQAFFANAEKGDKLLLYPKNSKAIIYNPTRNIIVNVGPINISK